MSGANRAAAATVVAVAALAFLLACVVHEAVGHGLACKAAGGHIALLTSVYFRCTEPGRYVAVAGPLANLVAGLAIAALPRARHPATGLFLPLAAAANLFWGAGYFVFSAVTDQGDLAFALRDFALEPKGAWRAAMLVAGVTMYYLAARHVHAALPPDAPVALAYLGMGTTSCAAVLFYQGPLGPALLQAFQEGFLAMIGLVLIAWRRRGGAKPVLPPSHMGWIVAAAIALPLFFAVLGRGVGSAL